ncbi:hypothetical protein [Dickeya ananatis]
MKIKELQEELSKYDPDATVLVAGFETTATSLVAEADTIIPCSSVPRADEPMSGNRALSVDGNTSIWIGWSKDYRTESFLYSIAMKEFE